MRRGRCQGGQLQGEVSRGTQESEGALRPPESESLSPGKEESPRGVRGARSPCGFVHGVRRGGRRSPVAAATSSQRGHGRRGRDHGGRIRGSGPRRWLHRPGLRGSGERAGLRSPTEIVEQAREQAATRGANWRPPARRAGSIVARGCGTDAQPAQPFWSQGCHSPPRQVADLRQLPRMGAARRPARVRSGALPSSRQRGEPAASGVRRVHVLRLRLEIPERRARVSREARRGFDPDRRDRREARPAPNRRAGLDPRSRS